MAVRVVIFIQAIFMINVSSLLPLVIIITSHGGLLLGPPVCGRNANQNANQNDQSRENKAAEKQKLAKND
jgi:hypothetical protein